MDLFNRKKVGETTYRLVLTNTKWNEQEAPKNLYQNAWKTFLLMDTKTKLS